MASGEDSHDVPSIDDDDGTSQCLDFDFGLPLSPAQRGTPLAAQEGPQDELDEDAKLPSSLDETAEMIDAALDGQELVDHAAADPLPSPASKGWDKLRHQFLRSTVGVENSLNFPSTRQFRVLHPPNNKADKRTGALHLKPFNLDLTSLGLNAIPTIPKSDQGPSSAAAFKSKFTGAANLGGRNNPSSFRGFKPGPAGSSASRAEELVDHSPSPTPATQLLQTFASLSSLRFMQLSQGIPPAQIQLRILTVIADLLSRLKVHLPFLPSQRRLLGELSRPLLAAPVDIVACRLAMDIFIRLTTDFKSDGEADELARWVFVTQALRTQDSITRKKALDSMRSLFQPFRWAPSGEPSLTSLVSALIRALIVFVGERSDIKRTGDVDENLESLILQQLASCSKGDLIRIDPITFAKNVGVKNDQILNHQTAANLITFKAFLDAAMDFNLNETHLRAYWADFLPVRLYQIRKYRHDPGHSAFVQHVVNRSILSVNMRFWPSFNVLPSNYHSWYFRLILRAFSSLPRLHYHSDKEPPMCDTIFTPITNTPHLSSQLIAFECVRLRHPPETLQSLPADVSSIFIESVLRLLSHTSHQTVDGETHVLMDSAKTAQALVEQITTYVSRCPSEPIIAAIDSISKTGSRTSLTEVLAPIIKLITHLSQTQKWISPVSSRAVGSLLSVIEDIQPGTIPGLSVALDTFRIRCPALFYKPIFTCAASNATEVIGRLLRNISTISSLVGEARFWFLADPDMLAVALFGGLTKASSSTSHWAELKLGQLCLIINVAICFKLFRREESAKIMGSIPNGHISAFGDAFETRLTALVGAVEQQRRFSPSARLLISALLMELRLLTRLPRRGMWTSRVIEWVETEDLSNGNVVENIRTTFSRLTDLYRFSMKMKQDPYVLCLNYMAHKAFARASRVSRMSFTKLAEPLSSTDPRIQWLAGLNEGPQSYYAILLSLISACYSSLVDKDLSVLVPLLFEVGLSSPHTKVLSASAFLIVQAAEKELPELTTYVHSRLLQDDPAVQLKTIQCLASLFSTRFSLLSQPIADQTRRKLFTAPKHQMAYVPVEVGGAQWVPPDDAYQSESLVKSTNIPIETRRALEELGWDEDQKTRQIAFERRQAPLTVLPMTQSYASGGDGEIPSRSNTPTPSLGRRSSAASMHDAVIKKQQRAVITPATAKLLMMASLLIHDSNTHACVIARKLIMDLLRDEPNAVLRPFTEDLSGGDATKSRTLNFMRSMLETNYCLPPVLVHQLFSHLVGWSKSVVRSSYRSDIFETLASALSVASAASMHVQQFNLKDVKRAKIEHMLISNGQLWFVEPARDRLLPTSIIANPSPQLERLSLPSVLFDLTRTRIAQIRLMAYHLRRQPKEAFSLRQYLLGCVLVLPVDEGLPSPLENRYFLPRTQSQTIIRAVSDPEKSGLRSLSRVLALSWLDLLTQVFSGLTTATASKQEFTELFDSINRILLCHSEELLIISNCLKVCMQVSTKFRRLFRVKGFAMFIPLVFKVYCEAKTCNFRAIMEAIAFAWKRWFICHGDAFIFQALAAVAPVITRAGVDEFAQRAMASALFDLLICLASNQPSTKRDVAALQGVNTPEEQATLSYLAKDRPELFLSNREASSDAVSNNLTPLDEHQTFEPGDLCKLFFTAIAFDPTSDRSGSFIRLLSLLVPHLTRLPTSSKILHEGVDALLKVYVKPSTKTGLGETPANTDAVPVGQKVAYMGVMTAFVEAGGRLTDASISRLVQLAYQIIRVDSAAGQLSSVRFLGSYIQAHTQAQGQLNTNKQLVTFLREILTLFKDTVGEIDFSSFLDRLQEFLEFSELSPKQELLIDINTLASLYVRYALGEDFAQHDLKIFSHNLRRSCARLSATIAKKCMLPSFTDLRIDPTQPNSLVGFLIPLALALPSQPTQATTSLVSSWIMLIATAVKGFGVNSFNTSRESNSERDRTLSFLLSIQLLKITLTKGFQALRANHVVWNHVADHLRSLLSFSAVSFMSILEPQIWLDESQREQGGIPAIEYATWSVCEWLSRFPSPLMLGLKHLVILNLQACQPFEQKSAKAVSEGAQELQMVSPRIISAMYLPQRTVTPIPSPSPSPIPTPHVTPARLPNRQQHLQVIVPESPAWIPPSPSLVPIAGAPTRLRHLGLTQKLSNESLTESQSQVPKYSNMTNRTFVLETVARIIRLQLIFGKHILDKSLIRPLNLDPDKLAVCGWGAGECLAEIERESEMINKFMVEVGAR